MSWLRSLFEEQDQLNWVKADISREVGGSMMMPQEGQAKARENSIR